MKRNILAYGDYDTSNPNAELEGGEVVETLQGETQQLEGPSHAQGGIDVNLPAGSNVYSDRLKIGEQTLADRKATREKRLEKIMKSYEKDPTNILLKNGLKRVKEANDFEDEKDLMYQEQVKKTMQSTIQEGLEQFAFGVYGFGDNPEDPQYQNYGRMGYIANGMQEPDIYNGQQGGDSRMSMVRNPINEKPLNPYAPTLQTKSGILATPPSNELAPNNHMPFGGTDEVKPEAGMGYTAGDIVGTVGTVVGSVSQMMNTIQNAKATKPVINHFMGFNEKALQANREAKDQAAYNKSTQESIMNRALDTAENTQRARTRGSASGINTMRAMDVAVDTTNNEARIQNKANLESNYGNQMLHLLGVDTQLLSQKDQMEMSGQTRADEANAANLDNFYTNFGQNLAGATQSMQKLGMDMNQARHRNDVLKVMKETNPWGLTFNSDMEMVVDPSKYSASIPKITKTADPKVTTSAVNDPTYDPASTSMFGNTIKYRSKYPSFYKS